MIDPEVIRLLKGEGILISKIAEDSYKISDGENHISYYPKIGKGLNLSRTKDTFFDIVGTPSKIKDKILQELVFSYEKNKKK